MRITSVSTVVVDAHMRNWLFVKVETDEPGLVGWGEASLEWRTNAVVGAVKDLAPLLEGQDPWRIEHLWQSMHRQHFFKGGIVTMSAISGIDQALWDIKAKSLGVPVWELLGGQVRDRVELYDHLGGGEADAVYNEASEETFAERARASVAAGFRVLKVLAVPPGRALESSAKLREAEALMGAVRDAVGDDVEVIVDFHGRTTPAMAIQYARVLEPMRPWFIEEPCQPENIEALAEVAHTLSIPIATGERLVGRDEFRGILERRACAILQPDVCHCGGISEIKRIAAMAESYVMPIAPHNPLGPIATAANIHVAFSTPNFLIQEVMRADVPWRDEVVTTPLQVVDGHVELPLAPGLGIEVDEDAAAMHPYVPEHDMRVYHADGAVGDW
jgi:galactonate dehydratase